MRGFGRISVGGAAVDWILEDIDELWASMGIEDRGCEVVPFASLLDFSDALCNARRIGDAAYCITALPKGKEDRNREMAKLLG